MAAAKIWRMVPCWLQRLRYAAACNSNSVAILVQLWVDLCDSIHAPTTRRALFETERWQEEWRAR